MGPRIEPWGQKRSIGGQKKFIDVCRLGLQFVEFYCEITFKPRKRYASYSIMVQFVKQDFMVNSIKALERSKKIPIVDCLFSKAVVTCEVECPCLKPNW